MTRIYSPNFKCQFSLDVTAEMRCELITISYMMGFAGKQKSLYSKAAKYILAQGVQEYISKLPPRKKQEFVEILKNVRIAEGIENWADLSTHDLKGSPSDQADQVEETDQSQEDETDPGEFVQDPANDPADEIGDFPGV
jgi:hypothetical protein